jgi:CRISPR-associated protein Csb2
MAFKHYARVRELTMEPEFERGEFTEMFIFGFPAGCPLPPLATLDVTHALRGAAMAHARPHPVEVLSGHCGDGQQTRRDHAAFLTLPDVGHDYADGHLLGVAVALPRLDAAIRGSVLRPLAAVHQLRLGRAGAWDVAEVRPSNRIRQGLDAAVWTRPSRCWATVTPVAVYPRQRQMTQQHVMEACRHSGLPEPTEIVISQHSPFLGTPPSVAFAPIPLHQRKGTLWHSHVVLSFRRPVKGPVIIGAGRYRGYGLCRPLEAA